MLPSRRRPRPTLCRRGIRILVIALPRRCQGTSPDAPTKYRELRGSVVMQECFRDNHTTHIVRSVIRSSFPPLFFSCRHLPARGTLRHGIKGHTIWRCVLSRCHTVTLTANPHLAFVRAVSAPVCRHPARQLRRSAVLKVWSGRLSPGPRPSPAARPPSVPKGGCAGCDWFEGWPDVAALRQAFRVGL